jgi:hypothetical protein
MEQNTAAVFRTKRAMQGTNLFGNKLPYTNQPLQSATTQYTIMYRLEYEIFLLRLFDPEDDDIKDPSKRRKPKPQRRSVASQQEHEYIRCDVW